MTAALSFNDDNDKDRENRGKKKRRTDVTHACGHKMSYPKKTGFDFNKNCCMCEEWENPTSQMDEYGTLI
jgi:hypothetical protein